MAGEPGCRTDTQAREGSAADAAKPAPVATAECRPAKTPWWIRHYTFTGTAFGLVFLWFSMTPSLLHANATLS